MSDKTEQNGNTLNFQIKRGQFYALLVPVAFLLGLTVGFLTWGRGNTSAAEVVASQGELALSQSEPSAQQQAAEPLSVAEQIETLERYEVPFDESDPSTGPADAPITLIEFSDFECPFCKRHFDEVYPRLLADYGDQIRFIYKDFPLTSIHANAAPAAIAAQCALEQEAFWPYHDLLFSGELSLSRSSYEEYASRLELDLGEFGLCLDEERHADAVQSDADFALEVGVRSTPTFFINGIGLVGAQPFDVFAQIIDYELVQANAAVD